jgi:peptidoglycan/xylan/chitin deacetylase (PgdA/CDA1 family)
MPATVFVTTGYVGENWPLDGKRSVFKMLTWKQIKEMSKNNIEIGAHTVSHPDLKELSLEEAKSEILNSKIELQNQIKSKVRFFSYPFGSHNKDTIDIVMSSGFEGAVGRAGTIGNDAQIFALNRIQVDSSVSITLFKARLTKAVDLLSLFEEPTKMLLNHFRR